MSIFVTGTDTGVGKTRVAAMLVRELRAAGTDAVGFKPICCGGREDAEVLADASGGFATLNDVNPVWLRPPVAPYTASMIEGRAVDLDLVRKTFARLRTEHEVVIVEGAGGWLVPVTRDFSMADLAMEFALPVLVVSANRLGVINHTLLTVAAIRSSGLRCAGVILNHPHAPTDGDPAVLTNRSVLEELLDVPVLGEVAFGDQALPGSVMRVLTDEKPEAGNR
jgi:dethiobiotin synthetase